MNILVTGGAGYIGSGCAQLLLEAGHAVTVLDALVTGHRAAVPKEARFIPADLSDRETLRKTVREGKFDAVMHFAAFIEAGESMRDPGKYMQNNVSCSIILLEEIQRAGIGKFVFSSTAAVYGIPEGGYASEDSPTRPINPYGASKLMSEWMLRDLAAATGLRHVTLRYFNVAGSDPGGSMGHSQPEATLLVKVACQAAVGVRPGVAVFGTDYPTPDGTGVRDYIHVEDLADAHLRAVDYLRGGGASATLNCGYGHGYTVREVLRMVEQVHGRPLRVTEQPRRAGDPPTLVARADLVRQVLGWRPRHDDLETIVATQLAWERTLQARPELCRN